MNHLRRLACAGLAATALTTLGACATGGLSRVNVPLTATLSAEAEVPPNSSTGTGSFEGRYDRTTRVLSWRVSYLGLTGPLTGAHLHGPAPAGANAGVVLPLPGPHASPFAGEATLTSEQAEALLAGNWYVNLHTARHAAGEIRGQVRPVP